FAIEDKFDGIRAHLHKDSTRVALFSRTLDQITGQFPDIAAELASVPGVFLLDGEIVAWREEKAEAGSRQAGRPDSFFKLQRRLGRKAPAPELLKEIPAVFIAFDCLFRDGQALFESPWEERRRHLVQIAQRGLRTSEVLSASCPEELEA